ncbi:uncharacterized protein LOC143070950 [Mytilus galloprovincialis]|uniref:uncharacterized protein LOC143070950 n=1 Tax=Mytilus galloprovincialis TaxID=29158 RepID=UPI003F7B5201
MDVTTVVGMTCAAEEFDVPELRQTDVVLDFNDRDNDESRQWCQDTDNMEIIMIKTLADYNEVTTKLTAESVATSLQFWIGLKWDEVEQNFYWIDNTILTWNRWCYEGSYNSDEPDCMTSSSSLRPCSTYFEKNQNCVRLTHDQQSAWCFATRPCGADYKTMCRGVSDSAEATTSTTTIKESTEAEAITTVPTYPETTTTHLQTTPAAV